MRFIVNKGIAGATVNVDRDKPTEKRIIKIGKHEVCLNIFSSINSTVTLEYLLGLFISSGLTPVLVNVCEHPPRYLSESPFVVTDQKLHRWGEGELSSEVCFFGLQLFNVDSARKTPENNELIVFFARIIHLEIKFLQDVSVFVFDDIIKKILGINLEYQRLMFLKKSLYKFREKSLEESRKHERLLCATDYLLEKIVVKKSMLEQELLVLKGDLRLENQSYLSDFMKKEMEKLLTSANDKVSKLEKEVLDLEEEQKDLLKNRKAFISDTKGSEKVSFGSFSDEELAVLVGFFESFEFTSPILVSKEEQELFLREITNAGVLSILQKHNDFFNNR